MTYGAHELIDDVLDQCVGLGLVEETPDMREDYSAQADAIMATIQQMHHALALLRDSKIPLTFKTIAFNALQPAYPKGD
jgi:hypothetical protein